jgi:hypothetical protein
MSVSSNPMRGTRAVPRSRQVLGEQDGKRSRHPAQRLDNGSDFLHTRRPQRLSIRSRQPLEGSCRGCPV